MEQLRDEGGKFEKAKPVEKPVEKPKKKPMKKPRKKRDPNAPKKPPSPWVVHVQAWHKANPGISYKQAMTDAGPSYHAAKKTIKK